MFSFLLVTFDSRMNCSQAMIMDKVPSHRWLTVQLVV